MYNKGDMVYAEAYKYLRHKSGRVIGFAIPGNMEDFDELDLDMSSMKNGNNEIIFNGMLKIFVPNFTHKGVKTKIVTSRYSNDDQIAIMLNGDELAMKRMQQWRDFAENVSVVAREHNELKTKFEATV